jgi:hypothetical protein
VVSWQVETSSVWFYLSNGLPNTEPCRSNGRVPSFPAFEDKILGSAQLADDRTDDCAFGAMMSLALRPIFRKLRFQMIADSSEQRSRLCFVMKTRRPRIFSGS